MNQLKEQEFKEKFEKEQLKRAVRDLDKEKIVMLKKEKEVEQERVAQEVNLAKRREKELKDEIERMEMDIKETQKIYEDKSRKVHEAAEVARKVSDQENLKRRLFEEKAQRIADLRARQNNLIGEKNTIDRIQAELKEGNMPNAADVEKMNGRINANAQTHLEDIRGIQNYNIENMKKKLDDDQRKLNSIKQDTFSFGNKPAGNLSAEEQLPRPISKRALAGQAVLENPDFKPPTGQAELYNQAYNPSLDALNNIQLENEKLKMENERLRMARMQAQDPANLPPQNFGPVRAFAQPPQDLNAARIFNSADPNFPEPQPAQVPRQGQAPYYPPARAPPQQYPPQNPPPAAVPNYPPRMPPPPQRGDFDDFLTSNFMQNQMKNVDLNEDERMLAHLTMMEADSLRMLSRIQPSSELYRFKLEQYKELSTQRAEAEKLIQEAKLKKMKRAIDMRAKEEDRRFDNQKFVDDVRKQTMAADLAKKGVIPVMQQAGLKQGLNDLNPKASTKKAADYDNPVDSDGGYNMNHGFRVHWDYVFGIPKNKKFCQLVYAIMNGDENLLDPQVVEARPCQDQNVQKNQCVIYQNNDIREIEPNKLTNLIIEVQMPTSLNNVEEYTSLGWTFINLFEVNMQLNRGKFKLPLYASPIYKNITKDAVDQLRPVMDCTILFRISYPWRDEFSNLKNLEPHLNHREFQIPALHIKQASLPGVLSSNLFGANQKAKQPQTRSSMMDESDADNDNNDTVGQLPNPARIPRPNSREGAPSTTTKPETPHDMIARSKGIKVR